MSIPRTGSRQALGAGARYGNLAVAFNPTSLITGAGGFWRADMGVTTSGSNVTQWNDQSSFANNLTNNGTASNVTFSSTGFNTSFSAVSLVDNSNGTMRNAGAFAAGTTATMFMLLSPATSAAGNCRWGFLAVSGPDFLLPGFTCFDSGTDKFQPYAQGAVGNGGNPLTLVNGTPTLVGVVFDGTHANTWQNGSVVGAASNFSSNLGAASSTVFGIGNDLDLNGSNGSAPGSHYAFWGITQKAMSSGDWTNLKNWSNSNWGTSF